MILKTKFIHLIFIVASAQVMLRAQSSSEVMQNNQEVLVTLHAEDAFLPGILSILARESGYNIVTDPNVNQQDKISIH